jgi:hypothetical protein
MKIFLLTVYDTADFDAVLHRAVYATHDQAAAVGHQYVLDYDSTMAETEDNSVFVGACSFDIEAFDVRNDAED